MHPINNFDIVKFQCLKCGRCCHNLLPVGEAGLMLFQNETVSFPKKMVKPCLGVGRSPFHRKFKIVTYQLTAQTCPHLINNECSIYDQRPLMCRVYPFRVKSNWKDYSFSFTPECSFIIELTKKYPATKEFKFESPSELEVKGMEAMIKMKDFFKSNDRKAKQYVYNLDTEKWDRYHNH